MPIIFNGQSYNSPEEMPPEVRQAYQQAMDRLGSRFGANADLINQAIAKMNSRLEDMPPDVRQRYEEHMSRLDKNHDGIPDFLQGDSATPGVFLSGDPASGDNQANLEQQINASLEQLPPELRARLEKLGPLAAQLLQSRGNANPELIAALRDIGANAGAGQNSAPALPQDTPDALSEQGIPDPLSGLPVSPPVAPQPAQPMSYQPSEPVMQEVNTGRGFLLAGAVLLGILLIALLAFGVFFLMR